MKGERWHICAVQCSAVAGSPMEALDPTVPSSIHGQRRTWGQRDGPGEVKGRDREYEGCRPVTVNHNSNIKISKKRKRTKPSCSQHGISCCTLRTSRPNMKMAADKHIHSSKVR